MGVSGGLAEYFGVDPTIVRLLFVLITLLANGLGILIYVVLAIMVPLSSEPTSVALSREEKIGEFVGEVGDRAKELAQEVKQNNQVRAFGFSFFFGLAMILTGLYWLVEQFYPLHVYWWWLGRAFWPAIVILFGLFLIFKNDKK